MTAAERQTIREARDKAKRSTFRHTVRQNSYDTLPAVDVARQMVSWVDCPVHGLKVGLDGAGHVIGRCSGCAEESVEAQVLIEGRFV